jgi:pimeloyl-ACP methyl ester carboxylesterase
VNPNSLILPNVYPEPLLPGTDRVKFKTPDLERIPKYYIYTTQDKIIPVEIQKKLTSRTNIKASDSVPAGHLPMLTQPAALAKLIDTFATAP